MFFVSQTTADETRISDWSSDVCSSDLGRRRSLRQPGVESRRSNPGRMLEHAAEARNEGVAIPDGATAHRSRAHGLCLSCQWRAISMRRTGNPPSGAIPQRAEEIRLVKEGCSPCRTAWSPYQ